MEMFKSIRIFYGFSQVRNGSLAVKRAFEELWIAYAGKGAASFGVVRVHHFPNFIIIS